MIDATRERLETLRAALERCTRADRLRLDRRLARLKRPVDPDKLVRLENDLSQANRRWERRRAMVPRVRPPADLPIAERWEELADTLTRHQVVIVCGETGSGKTTQLPKLCLALGRGVDAMIGHTQPRRLAARTVAQRIASELDTELGAMVAYKVRFGGSVSEHTLVKLMTDGILLSELKNDPLLNKYDTIIIDEAHERSLNIDFLLGYLRTLLPRRSDLKVIVTSATIDPERFSRHFDDAPIVNVAGRVWPVEVTYRPLEADKSNDTDLTSGVVDACRFVLEESKRDVLVFLSGEREIRECEAALRKVQPSPDIVALTGRMDASSQERAFVVNPDRRKIVLATNVAETSVTLPNIGAVIDTGQVRLSRYNTARKIQTLPVESVSKASAEQRKGRCGRTGPGLCVRLYSSSEYDSFEDYTPPEIRRTNLAQIILKMKELGLGAVLSFPFIDPPETRFVKDGIALLDELGALDREEKLTHTGRGLARLPVDPRVGAMILAAAVLGSLHEVLVIVAAFSGRDPFDVDPRKRVKAKSARENIRDTRSDFLMYVNFWRLLHTAGKESTAARLRKLCNRYHVSWMRVREWQDLYQQLVQVTQTLGLKLNKDAASYASVHRAILAGCLGQFGVLAERGEYRGARDISFRLSTASSLYGRSVKWLMVGELVETAERYGHRAARIRPEWVENAAPEHLLRRSYANPRYTRSTNTVQADESIAVHGIRILTRRCKRYHEVDPVESNKVFIAALVEGKVVSDSAFHRHNQRVISALKYEQDKLRRTDIVADDAHTADLYAGAIPPHVCTLAQFEQWSGQWPDDERHPLWFCAEQLRRVDAPVVDAEQFPDYLAAGGNRLTVSYRFEPKHRRDGMTITVPLALVNQLPTSVIDRIVPGRLEEKVLALLRTLPKTLRRKLVPMPETARCCLELLANREVALTQELSTILKQIRGVSPRPGDWHPERLAPYLRVNVVLVDARSQTVAEGRDVGPLFHRHRHRAREDFEVIRPKDFDRRGLTSWSFEELPVSIEFEHARARIRGYPTLVDRGDSVDLTLVDNPEQARSCTYRGLLRLLGLRHRRRLRDELSGIVDLNRHELLYSSLAEHRDYPVAETEPLRLQIAHRAIELNCVRPREGILNRVAFERWADSKLEKICASMRELAGLAGTILEAYHRIRQSREACFAPGLVENFDDIDRQLSGLVFRGFLQVHRLENLRQIPRYLEALERRLEKLPHSPRKDLRKTRNIRSLGERSDRSGKWLVEELRVATFAQEIGTPKPISLDGVRELLERTQSET